MKRCGLVVLIGMLSAMPALAGGYNHTTPTQPSTPPPSTGTGTGTGTPTTPQLTNQYVNGASFTNIWSGAQGTSLSYGQAKALGMSNATSVGNAGGGLQPGTFGYVGGVNGATSSFAKTMSVGAGYAQSQTSGYAGGTVGGNTAYGGR
jgi:hypothetical protein